MLACVALHNMLRTACADEAALGDSEDEQHSLIAGSWRDGAVLDDMKKQLYDNTSSRAAMPEVVDRAQPAHPGCLRQYHPGEMLGGGGEGAYWGGCLLFCCFFFAGMLFKLQMATWRYCAYPDVVEQYPSVRKACATASI